jgi:hypothetical protein
MTRSITQFRSFKPWALFVLGTALIAAMLTAIYGRGPWYDEFYTYYVTRPEAGFGTLWAEWMRDNHPPSFYCLAWLTNWLGHSMAQRRLVNLAFLLIGCLALGLLCRKRRELRPLAFPYVLALAGYFPAVDRASELRSNFLAYAAASVAIATLTTLTRPNQPALSRRAFAFLVGSLAVAFSVHFAASVIIGAMGVAFGLRLMLLRDWRGVSALALAGGLAALPFTITTAAQFTTLLGNTHSFWTPPGLNAARWAIEGEVLANLRANPPLTLAGVVGLCMLIAQDWSRRRASVMSGLVLTLAGGIILAISVLVFIHLQRPFVIDRYLVCLHPPIAMLLAIGVMTLASRLGGKANLALDVAMLAGALLAINTNMHRTLARPSWDGTGAAIARIVRSCPETIVHADMSWNQALLDVPPAENRSVLPFAYNWIAANHGFRLTPFNSQLLARRCPTVFWTEHVGGQHPDTIAIAHRLQEHGFAVSDGKLSRIGNGWIYVASP